MPDSGFVDEACGAVRQATPLIPRVAIVLGSGLGPLAGEVTAGVTVPYSAIPHFARSTAPGHDGRLVLGYLENQPVVVMAGRFHLYEGYTPKQVVLPIQTMRQLGAKILIVTNAAGGVRLDFEAGALMLISDHINLTGQSPLVGPNDPALGVRFPDMTSAYDQTLLALARRIGREINGTVAEGVYLGLTGPSYETPAEIRMARAIGADAVGMSTVMEVIAARHMGMRVLGISCITNMAAGILPQLLSEEEVIETAARVRVQFSDLVRGIVKAL